MSPWPIPPQGPLGPQSQCSPYYNNVPEVHMIHLSPGPNFTPTNVQTLPQHNVPIHCPPLADTRCLRRSSTPVIILVTHTKLAASLQHILQLSHPLSLTASLPFARPYYHSTQGIPANASQLVRHHVTYYNNVPMADSTSRSP